MIKDLFILLLAIGCLIALGTTKDWRIMVIGATAFGAMCEIQELKEKNDK